MSTELENRPRKKIGEKIQEQLSQLEHVHIAELDAWNNDARLFAAVTRLIYWKEIDDEIANHLRRGTSVLVYTEPEIVPYLIGWIMKDKYQYQDILDESEELDRAYGEGLKRTADEATTKTQHPDAKVRQIAQEADKPYQELKNNRETGHRELQDRLQQGGCYWRLSLTRLPETTTAPPTQNTSSSGTDSTDKSSPRSRRSLVQEKLDAFIQLRNRRLRALAICIYQWQEAQRFPGLFVLEDLDLMIGHEVGNSVPAEEIISALRQMETLFTHQHKITLLAFADSTQGRLAESVERFFPKLVTLGGVMQDGVWQILENWEQVSKLFPEARSELTIEHQQILCKYLANLNPVRAIRLIRACVADIVPNSTTDDLLKKLVGGNETVPRTSKDDIAGYNEVKAEIETKIIAPIKSHGYLGDVDANRGLLLYGPPGTGKTELAKWIAHEASASFYHVSGPELKNKWVGETERQIRSLFARARRSAPAVILIDEVDAMTVAREAHMQEYAASMVAQLLTEMDGLHKDEAITVIGTTNRRDRIDAGFLRPGRFSLQIHVDYPSETDIQKILDHYINIYQLKFGDTMPTELTLAQWVAKAIWESSAASDKERQDVEAELKKHVTAHSLSRHEAKALEESFIIHRKEAKLNNLFAGGGLAPNVLHAMATDLTTAVQPRWSGDHLRGFCAEWGREQQQKGTTLSKDELQKVLETISQHYVLEAPHLA